MAKRSRSRTKGAAVRSPSTLVARLPAHVLSEPERRVLEAAARRVEQDDTVFPATDTDRAMQTLGRELGLRITLLASEEAPRRFLPRLYLYEMRRARKDSTSWRRVWVECAAPVVGPDSYEGLRTLAHTLRRELGKPAPLALWACPVPREQHRSFLVLAELVGEPPQAYLLLEGVARPLLMDESALGAVVDALLVPAAWQARMWRETLQASGDTYTCVPATPAPGADEAAALAVPQELRRCAAAEINRALSETEDVLDGAQVMLVAQRRDHARELERLTRNAERRERAHKRTLEKLQMAYDGLRARAARQDQELAQLAPARERARATTGPAPIAASPAGEQGRLVAALARWF